MLRDTSLNPQTGQFLFSVETNYKRFGHSLGFFKAKSCKILKAARQENTYEAKKIKKDMLSANKFCRETVWKFSKMIRILSDSLLTNPVFDFENSKWWHHRIVLI